MASLAPLPAARAATLSRVRPGDPLWPQSDAWRQLGAGLDGTLLWAPFLAWAKAQAGLAVADTRVVAGPGRLRWDGVRIAERLPQIVCFDDRPGASRANYYWAANRAQAGHVIHDFESLWLPAALLMPAAQARLADALAEASRHWTVEMHVQKGLAGAPQPMIDGALDTPMNPVVTKSFMLAILASEGPPAFPGVPGHEPDVGKARRDRARIAQAVAALRPIAPQGGAYLAEASYFQNDWQHAFWGDNYDRLLAVKRRYDPDGLFFLRHGVGSEAWSEDGFTRLA